MKKLLVLLALLFALPVWAEYFHIKNYDVNIHVDEDSVLNVTEVITVEFTSPRHGIYRTIPYRYEKRKVEGEQAERFDTLNNYYSVSIYDIKTPGENSKITKEGDNIKIRIGDADQYVNGEKTYTVSYRVYGAVNNFSDHAEIYWNVIGNGWDVRIDKSSFRLLLPKEHPLAPNDVAFFTGYFGERGGDASLSYTKRLLTGETKRFLHPGEGFTIVVRLPKDYLNSGGLGLKLRLLFANFKAFFIAGFIIILIWLTWFLVGRDEEFVEMVHFHPPKGVTPAEAGVLINDSTDAKDLVTMIFYWGSEGIITIEETEDKGLIFKSKDYIISKTGELPSDAKIYEKTMFSGLFPGTTKNRRISELKQSYYTTMNAAKSELDVEVSFKDYYEPYTRGFQKLFYVLAAFTGVGSIPLSISTDNYQLLVSGMITAAAFAVFGRYMPKKSIEGMHDYRALVGFKEFIKKAEKDKLKMLIAEDPMYFDKTLPFAMALGELKHWGEKFEGLMDEPPRWYAGSHYHHNMFRTSVFANQMADAMGSMATTMTSTPPSSGGSGGSGFSGGGGGGGFGGGGGGSW